MSDTIKILKDLISVQSDTHDKVKNIADYICDFLDKNKIIYQRIRHTNNPAESIIAGINTVKLRDINHGILLSGHMDTVDTIANQWTTQPFVATTQNNQIYGRGVVDMKYFIAVILGNISALKKYDFPIILAFTGDEETDVTGAKHICDFMKQNNIKPQMGIVGEPTDFEIYTSHNGYCGFTTEIWGKSAHGSQITQGINSVYIAATIINHIKTIADQYLNKGTTVNVGKITGGTQRNTVPGQTKFEWEIRFSNPNDKEEIINQVDAFIKSIMQQNEKIKINTINAEQIPALNQNTNSKITEIISDITNATKVCSAIATEAGFFAHTDIDIAVFGAGDIKQAHTANEHIEINDIFKYEDILLQILKKLY